MSDRPKMSESQTNSNPGRYAPEIVSSMVEDSGGYKNGS